MLPLLDVEDKSWHTIIVQHDHEKDLTSVKVDQAYLGPLQGRWVLAMHMNQETEQLFWSVSDDTREFSKMDRTLNQKFKELPEDYTIISLIRPGGLQFINTQNCVMTSDVISDTLSFLQECHNRKIQYDFDVLH